ncbi:TonB-dependent receptor plug domain-containing protein [uncultured Flavobacterium sp.]|uniref:TonB-dependent receptor plug domain-containing protein n=1 Tax=uncultured Flavobacterium sp. TaxID=165435 RepID=UPI00259376FE|nr:TonB-dependent receptor plug domain-containing protein [uncultured Flavobacterium sp.]
MKALLNLFIFLFTITTVFAQETTDNSPLIVVNGNILHKDVLEAIDPKNIESVNVLKDKAATAVYGQSAKNGVILITTKDISKRELKKLYKKYLSENSINKETDVFKISGTVYDCEKLELSGVYIKNLNSKAETQTDIDGKFSIEVKINDILEISFLQFKSQKIKIENKENLIVNLKAEQQIILEKPVIYLYPTEKKAIDIKLDLKGELLTTFPKYDKSWEVIAEPNGQIFDKKTNRYYSSLFWDGTIDFPSAHYKYDDGFIVSKDNLTEFLIKKLDLIGLNNQETNEFIQYWLPILERNKYNFIHFLVNEECNKIATLNVNPKPETSIRIYMEFYGLENRTIIKEQQLPKTERKGFTLVEWGGADFTGEMSEEDFFKINDLPILNGITLICKRRDINDIKPLYVIDNKISSKRIFDRLNPSEIKKIETFSGKDGVALYGSDGVGGIFIITTKNPKK